ncbi:MAG: 30S ribosomal protein S18 [Holosporales bacterium]|jgi:small subunit ribosomal protein S18|nr:30S ribosomal protein S18 [Holosporales bacterium]
MNISTSPENNEKEQIRGEEIDYKNVRFISRFVSERGKIIPSRINNQSVKKQREIAKAIKRARILALLPFI